MSAQSQPLPEGGPMGAPPTPPTPPTPVRKRWSRLVIVFAAVVLLLLGLNAYLFYAKVLRGETPAAPVATQPGVTQTGANTPPATTPGSPATTTSTKAPTSATATTEQPTGPQIAYFRVKQQPACPAGTDQYPVDPIDVIIEWKVSGADSTELAVDGPGLYGAYGLEASQSLSFPCQGTPGTYAIHTYTLTTVGGGPVRSRTLTVKALINEIGTT